MQYTGQGLRRQPERFIPEHCVQRKRWNEAVTAASKRVFKVCSVLKLAPFYFTTSNPFPSAPGTEQQVPSRWQLAAEQAYKPNLCTKLPKAVTAYRLAAKGGGQSLAE